MTIILFTEVNWISLIFQGKSDKILENLKRAYKFRQDNEELITKGNFISLKTVDDKVFAFLVYSDQEFLLVIGNLDFKNGKSKIVIKDSKIKKNFKYEIINGQNNIKIQKKKFITSLNAGEIKVIKITK